MRTMYDAINPAGIPANPQMVAGYDDGRWPDFATMVTMFPHAIHVPVTVFASDNEGIVLDVETGDATPAQAPNWVLERRAAGVKPSVYCNASTWPSVIQTFLTAGVDMPPFWIAQYDGNPTLPTVTVNGVKYTAVAKQYSDPTNYDISAVADYWPGVDPIPSQPEGLPMKDLVFGRQTGSNQIWVGNGMKRRLVPDVPTLQGMQWWVSQVGGDSTIHTIDNLWVLGDVDPDVAGGLTKVESDVIAAIKAQPTGGQVDVQSLANALAPVLVPLLPADATPQQVGAAVVTALAAHLNQQTGV